jgi:hypothetical protein
MLDLIAQFLRNDSVSTISDDHSPLGIVYRDSLGIRFRRSDKKERSVEPGEDGYRPKQPSPASRKDPVAQHAA